MIDTIDTIDIDIDVFIELQKLFKKQANVNRCKIILLLSLYVFTYAHNSYLLHRTNISK